MARFLVLAGLFLHLEQVYSEPQGPLFENDGNFWSGVKVGLRLATRVFVTGHDPGPSKTTSTSVTTTSHRAEKDQLTVFTAGFVRTGTASLAEAFKILGLKPMHGPDVIPLAEDVRRLHELNPRYLLRSHSDANTNDTHYEDMEKRFSSAIKEFLNTTIPAMGFNAAGLDTFG